jgi:drug/metabolite transporter (DMT)-like permease
MASPKKISFSLGWLILSQCMIAVNIVFTKQLLSFLPPYIILFFRFSIAFLVLSFIQVIIKPKAYQALKNQTWQDWFIMILQAMCAGVFFNMLMLLGLHETTASMAGMIFSALPAVVVIFAIIFLGVKITWPMLLCVGLAVTGLVMMNVSSVNLLHHQWFGDLMVFLSLIPEALYYILTKRFSIKMPIILLSAVLNAINIPVLFLLAMGHHENFTMNLPPHVWSLLFVIGLSSAGFYVFWFLGCTNVHGVAVGLSTAFMPIATILLAYLWLGETVQYWQMFGMAIILLSIIVHAVFQR